MRNMFLLRSLRMVGGALVIGLGDRARAVTEPSIAPPSSSRERGT